MPQMLEKLHHFLRETNQTAIIIPSTDPHGSEYLPEHWKFRSAVSGFTGSAGDLVVTADRAGLWTDSRYFLQAESQLAGSGIELFRMGLPDTPPLWSKLMDWCPSGSRVAFFGQLHPYTEIARQRPVLAERGVDLHPVPEDVIDRLWTDRPALSDAPAFVHPFEFAGQTVTDKLLHLRGLMKDERADAHVVTALDSVAWLMNLRGSDIAYNPLVIAYALVLRDEALLFVPEGKLPPTVIRELEASGVGIRPYEAFLPELGNRFTSSSRIWVDVEASSWAVVDRLGGAGILEKASPITLLKAIKNAAELDGMRACHVRDGVAMVKFLKWMDENVPSGRVTELGAAQRLLEFRQENERFVGLSFETISAYGPHGAIVHYAPDAESDVPVGTDSLYLIDSGGQYLDGTTDITRTVSFGRPGPTQIEHFTRVLAGHLQLSITSFPQGTSGKQLDTIARMPLWEAGLQYGHGTGHGIGAFLGVHEGPHAISYYRCRGQALVPGMITSNEPGLYVQGSHGIRIENVLAVVSDPDRTRADLAFYRFDNLTMCPIDRKLVSPELLTPSQLRALNAYHALVRTVLLPHLDAECARWLTLATEPVEN
ncbi:aminopeptidase P family protein [Myxococcota bacterium]|nr:aminopeptidase P family protein [Myxococcota bacterium]